MRLADSHFTGSALTTETGKAHTVPAHLNGWPIPFVSAP